MVSPSGPGPGPVSIPQPNDPLTQVHSKTHEDLDLYELLSRFQCLSDKANKEPQSIGERKKKHKKKNLIVGEFSSQALNSQRNYQILTSVSYDGLDVEIQ
ncbi:hypothetical protein Tco_1339430 [Tanacetum coccineum]